MKTKFKVGDYAYCIEPMDKLRYGKIYRIRGLDGILVGVENHEAPYYADRFIHAIPDNKLNRVLFPDYEEIDGWLVEKLRDTPLNRVVYSKYFQRGNYGESI